MAAFSRTFHPDEANQAFTVGRLLETGHYAYNPADHHGPTLYYAAAPIQKAFGHLDTASLDGDLLRATPLVFAVLTVVFAALACRRLVKRALLPVLPLATLPALFFYATDFIQETLLGCFLMAAYYFGVRYAQSAFPPPDAAPERIKPGSWAILLGVSLGLAAATKETCVLSFAAATLALWPCLRGLTRPRNLSQHVVLAIVASFATALMLYSDFGRDFSGVKALLSVPVSYWNRALGSAAASTGAAWHVHPWHWYFTRCFAPGSTSGFAIGVLFLCLAASAFAKRRSSLGDSVTPAVAFLVRYAIVLMAFYVLIPYKTPWCMLTVLEAMALACGILFFRRAAPKKHAVVAVLGGNVLFAAAVAFQVCGCERIAANPDAASIPWNYAHASPQARDLANAAEAVLKANPTGFLAVALPPENTWPFPWYNRANESRTGYWTTFEGLEEMAKRGEKPVAVIVPAEEGHLVQPLFPHLKNTKRFEMRPRVRVRLFW